MALDFLSKSARALEARVRGIVSRAAVTLITEAAKTQRVQISILKDDQEPDDVENVQPYGFSAVAPDESEAIALALGGSRSSTIAILVHKPDARPQDGADGDVGLYTEGAGWLVYLEDAGTVNLGAKSGAAAITRDDHAQTELDRLKTELDAVKTDLTTLKTAIGAAATVPTDGGAAFKAALVAALAAWPAMTPASPGATACDNVRGT